ncbi:hypothetical protein HELRODRAFT_170066 [Helobdella robusta]|uniref:CBS domain-containing protein n=1 Tax=Helobdella robusta TaxID=6412 RepID=T1F2L5_HELRO|nr:hypothetical protein HELRODRAFT_170066 [Helobdella robusta]ESO07525.1 hypothetical protein HELRODRAFT_170066 [Helobdella robusta]
MNFMTVKSDIGRVVDILRSCPCRNFPVVDNAENMMLLGTIQRRDLMKVIYKLILSVEDQENVVDRTKFETLKHLNESSNEELYDQNSLTTLLHRVIDVSEMGMDKAPFQIVDETSLYKVRKAIEKEIESTIRRKMKDLIVKN